MRNRKHDDDDPRILRDGERLRIPLHMMDSMQRQIAASLHDSNGGPVGHKPGFIFSTDAALSETKRQSMYDDYDRWIEQQWREPDIPVREPNREDARSTHDSRQSIYEQYDAALREQWRNP